MAEEKDTAETPADESAPTGGEETRVPVSVYDLLRYVVGLLHSHAWQSMGLVTNPATGEATKDLAQARVAIDTIAFLLTKLEEAVTPAERNELERLLSDLRMNFVEHSGDGD